MSEESKSYITASSEEKENMSFDQIVYSPKTKASFRSILGGRTMGYLNSLLGLWNTTPELQDCVPTSIIQCAMQAATLDLSLDKNLGYVGIVPYSSKKKIPVVGEHGEPVLDTRGNPVTREAWVKEAQFQIMSNGFRCLALRTNKYVAFNVDVVYKTDKVTVNRLTGEVTIEFNPKLEKTENLTIEDLQKRKQDLSFNGLVKAGVAGYFCHIKMVNGYEHTEYWPITKIAYHGLRYSKTFAKGTGLWTTNFDAMAKKTVVKECLKKYGELATYSNAFEMDQKVYTEDSKDGLYLDNPMSSEKEKPDQQMYCDPDSAPRKNKSVDDVLNAISSEPKKQPSDASAEEKPKTTPHQSENAPQGPSRGSGEERTADPGSIITAFARFGINRKRLEDYIECPLEEATSGMIMALETAYKHLMNGETPESVFGPEFDGASPENGELPW